MVVGATASRALVVFGMFPILEAARLVQSVNARYKAILVWGGVRGAVTVVLAMLAAVDQQLPDEARNFIAISATLFVLFTLIVNGTTLGPFLHVLGLDKLSRQEIALRDRIRAVSRANVARRLAQVEGAAPVPSAADKADAEAPVDELKLDVDERLGLGLSLSLWEKQLYLSLFDQQVLSRRMVARLAAEADRLIDEVRSHGEPGYDIWLERISHPDRGYRLALWLQRRFGIEWFLKKKLADRFEILMVSQSVLSELAASTWFLSSAFSAPTSRYGLPISWAGAWQGFRRHLPRFHCGIRIIRRLCGSGSSSVPASDSTQPNTPNVCAKASPTRKSTRIFASALAGAASC